MTGATQALATFASRLEYDAIPEPIRARMKRHLLDSIGCAIYSTGLPHCQAVVGMLEEMRGAAHASILGTTVRTSSAHAALANGTLISGFELDDVGVYVHPGACIVAAGLAAAEHAGGVDGKRLLRALVIGYETIVRIAECVGPESELEIGWHTPPFHGAIGGAACAGNILGLDEAEMLRALSVSADLAGGGLMSARYGADVKRLHCGRAAEAAVLAAFLGQRGFTGTPDVLERDPWGYCSTISYTGKDIRNYDLGKITEGLGESFVGIERIAIKYYPIGGDQHSIVENIVTLKREHGITPEMVERVTIGSTRFAFNNKLRTPAENLTTANFSARYCAAMALMYEMPPVHESDLLLRIWPEAYKRADVVALQSRIEEIVDEDIDRSNPYSVDTNVVIRLKDGRSVNRRTEWVKGTPSHGTIRLQELDDRSIEAKFRNMATMRLKAGQTEALIAAVHDLELLKDARELVRLATPS